MNKSYEELATEMTVAWFNAVGQACSSGKFGGDWLGIESITKVYTSFFKTIIEETKSSPE